MEEKIFSSIKFTSGVIENTPRVFKIFFGVMNFVPVLEGKTAVQTGGKCLCKRERDVGKRIRATARNRVLYLVYI